MTAAVTDPGLPPGTGEACPPDGTEHPGPSVSGPGRPTGKPTLKLVLLGLGCSAAWLASVLFGGYLDPGPAIHRIALAAHILALVLSFGAILVLDWVGLLWLLGRRDAHRLPPGTLFTAMAAGLRARLLAALCISQTCWWTSVLVGLLNSTLRRWTGA